MYMLLNVDCEKDSFVSGNFIQWCCACSLAEAIKMARETECVNSNRIDVAVIDESYSISAEYFYKRKRLDIKRNWNPINDSTSYSTTVLFKVSKNGEISNCHVVKSSGNNDKDNRAIESVNKASPLAPFPAGANLQQIDIQFTFDYNVVGKQSQGDTSKDYQSVSNITYGKILEINVKNQLLCNIDKYMKYFRGSIAYWLNPTVEKVSRKTVVSLVLSKYGNVRTLEIVDKSGSDKFDKSVLHAINRAMPFKTLPPNYSAKTLNLELIFQSNAKNTAHSALQQMLNTSHGPLKLQYEIPIK